MNDNHSVTLDLPPDLSARVRDLAARTAQPVEQVLLDYLKSLPLGLPPLPADQQAELDALRHLSDDALWTIAREQMPEVTQNRAHGLMEKSTAGTLSDEESAELDALAQRADRLMLRKAEAAALLRQRGYDFQQQDFRQTHE